MPYPYTELVQLLQIRTTPRQYQNHITKYATTRSPIRPFNIGQDYWEILPVYLRTICPFCMHRSFGQVDTCSLLGKKGSYQLLFSEHKKLPDFLTICPHFLAFRQFLNFHGLLPMELSYYESRTGEVPDIDEWCLPAHIESYAVLHALPICRIVDREFVPTYTYFNVSYFSAAREAIIRQRFEAELARGKGDPEFYPAIFYDPSPHPAADRLYDLQAWATQGKLGYVDFTQAALPLVIGQGTQLPDIYRNIQGKRQRFIWRDGQFEYHG